MKLHDLSPNGLRALISLSVGMIVVASTDVVARAQAADIATPTPGGTWQVVTSATATILNPTNPMLLTDGTVIIRSGGGSNTKPYWFKLTPDSNGSYVNGTATQIASLPVINGLQYAPVWFSSAVLPDGRALVEGGRLNVNPTAAPDEYMVSMGAIYDPVADTWTSIAPPSGAGWTNTLSSSCNGGVGDAPSIILPNGTFMMGASCASPAVNALFNAATMTWTATGAPTAPCQSPFSYFGCIVGQSFQSGQSYVLLQNSKIMTLDTFDAPTAQVYDPSTGTWSYIANAPTSLLVDPCATPEGATMVSRPDGTVVVFGDNTGDGPYFGLGCAARSTTDPTAIYNSSNNTWTMGPSIPSINGLSFTMLYAPAILLPTGNILFAASPIPTQSNGAPPPTHFFEFTTTNTIVQVSDPVQYANLSPAYGYRFLTLPTGQILAVGGDIEVYTPSSPPQAAYAPNVTQYPACVSLVLSGGGISGIPFAGTQLAGLSSAGVYGVQGNSNYPLMQIVNNSTGHISYARTSGFSTTSIAPGQPGQANFLAAANTELGHSTAYAVAGGVSSSGRQLLVSFSCSARTHDFNVDGDSDILLRDGNGDIAIWLMNGTQVQSAQGLGSVAATWSIAAQRDFDRNGTYDLLWRDSLGNTAIWFMAGTTVSSTASLGNVPPAWMVVGTGDFNGDGKGDILWQDTSGNLAVWLMNGSALLSGGGLGNVKSPWAVAGTGDFNGDGMTDILWRDSSGDAAIWFMNGAQVSFTASAGNIPTTWSLVGTGDFNGDGMADILWRDNTGNTAIWLMNGAAPLQVGGLGAIPSTWSVIQIGDYNKDGRSDILWRDGGGNVAMWLMAGTTISSSQAVGNIPTAWTVQSVNSD